MAYMLGPMQRFRIPAVAMVLAFGAVLSACAPTMGPPSRGGMGPRPGASADFRASDFAWSTGLGRNGLTGRLTYKAGTARYTCASSSVILTPETPWTRQRMLVLYRSTERAALPADQVRARTPAAPPGGDYSDFVRRATCDDTDRFSFSGLPNGAWYVITIARPVAQPNGASVALMRRVVTRGGRVTAADL
jgi:hypothetical protein